MGEFTFYVNVNFVFQEKLVYNLISPVEQVVSRKSCWIVKHI